jgi:arginyl-tRNA--protein-N-Asp/Glu arginylyltransferase
MNFSEMRVICKVLGQMDVEKHKELYAETIEQILKRIEQLDYEAPCANCGCDRTDRDSLDRHLCLNCAMLENDRR